MPIPLAAIPLIISGGTAVIGAAMAIGEKISAWRKKSKNKKGKAGKYVQDKDDIKLISTLSKDQQNTINALMPYLESHSAEFLEELPKIDTSKLEQIAAQQSEGFPTAQELGFPQIQDITGDIRSETDFAPIEKQIRRQFQEEILPGIQEQFAGLGGGTRSSGFQGAAQAGGERLAESLAALKSKFGLERGSVLGQLDLKQQALGQERALGAGQLGIQRQQLGQAGQAQQFGQQMDLANLGLAQTTQELQRREQGLGVVKTLLGQGGLTPIIPQPPIPPSQGLGAQLAGQGLKGLGQVDYGAIMKAMKKTSEI